MESIIGKGNATKYKDRFQKIYAAGVRTLEPELRVADCFNNYTIQRDTENSPSKKPLLPKIRHSTVNNDMRNAGPYSEGSQLINPPVMTKFETLIEDLKCTVYKSYWNKEVGKRSDQISFLPPNIDPNIRFGKKDIHPDTNNLYNIIMPNVTTKNVSSEQPGLQVQRNYCNSYNPDSVFGKKTNADINGKFVKCCLIDERVAIGTFLSKPILTTQRNNQLKHRAELGVCLTPNKNINSVPDGHTFGKVEPKDNNIGSFTTCNINSKKELLKNSLAHLNTLRKCLSKRFDSSFFHTFYLKLKYLDNAKGKNGWLPKELIYHLCNNVYIRFNPTLIEPLLLMWEAVTESDIEYKTFINVINFREPLPNLPKIQDISSECTDFTTTYMDMVKLQQVTKDFTAGIPSGRYFVRDYPTTPNGYCKADRSNLPHESDARACLSPSIFTLLGINHRDMYTEREPHKVRKIFESADMKMSNSLFNTIWKNATKYHPKGLVCYETFRRAMEEYENKA